MTPRDAFDRPDDGPSAPRAADADDRPQARSGRRRLAGWAAIVALCALPLVLLVVVLDDGDLGEYRPEGVALRAALADAPQAEVLGVAESRRALEVVLRDRRPGELLRSVSLVPARLAVVHDGPGDRRRAVYVRPGGRLRELPGDDRDDPALGVRAVDPTAPGRLLAAIARGLGPAAVGRARVAAILAGGSGRAITWSASLRGVAERDAAWVADAAGRRVVRAADGAPAPRAGASGGGATTPSGTAGSSLLAAANLRRALALVREDAGAGARVTHVELTPEDLKIGTLRDGRRRRVAVDAAFGVRPLPVVPGGEPGIAFADVDPRTPERALSAIRRRAGADATPEVSVVVSRGDDAPAAGRDRRAPRWTVMLEKGGEWTTTDGGRTVVRRTG